MTDPSPWSISYYYPYNVASILIKLLWLVVMCYQNIVQYNLFGMITQATTPERALLTMFPG